MPGAVHSLENVRHKAAGEFITPADLEAGLDRIGCRLQPFDIVLVNTRASRCIGSEEYLTAGCGMGREATLYLLEKGVPPDSAPSGQADLLREIAGEGKIEAVKLLLDHGADPNVRASLRKRLLFVADESMHEYRDVTPLLWGERFHGPASPGHTWVSRPAMRLIAERGGMS